MRWNRARDRVLCAALAAIFVGADRLIKRWALTLGEGGAREGIPHVFRFSFAWNEGAAFSMLRARPQLVAAASAAVLLLVAGAVFVSRGPSLRVRLSLTLSQLL